LLPPDEALPPDEPLPDEPLSLDDDPRLDDPSPPDAGPLDASPLFRDESPLFGDKSPPLVGDSLVDPAAALSEPPPSEPPSADAPARAADREAAPRSFFAQPLPLKWNVGGAKPFRTGPSPQTGQRSGPGALTPWITSKRCPQWAQT
jgi:hypothetical protein